MTNQKSLYQHSKLLMIGMLLLALLIGQFNPALAITYGTVDAANQYSNVGVIWIPDPVGQLFQYCSGTLIGARELLTAGHCTHFIDKLIDDGEFMLGDVWVSFDPLGANNPATFWPVQALVTHPKFRLATAQIYSDIGMVVLADEPGIAPAQLAEVGYLEQLKQSGALGQGQNAASVTVVGYGAQLKWPPPLVDYAGPERRYGTVIYQSLTSKWFHYNQNPVTGGGGICYGDSGGPTYWTESDGDLLIIGVNSWVGAVSCNANGYSYRVDLPEIRSFIDDVMNQ